MSLTHDGDVRLPLTLTSLPFDDEREPLFPVDPQLVAADPPSLQDGLLAGALLWCVHSTWPTVRAIAACAGLSGSTVLWPYGTIEAMRAALVRAERTALGQLVDQHAGDLVAAIDARVEALAAHDARLSKLPLVVALAAGVHDAHELSLLGAAVRRPDSTEAEVW